MKNKLNILNKSDNPCDQYACIKNELCVCCGYCIVVCPCECSGIIIWDDNIGTDGGYLIRAERCCECACEFECIDICPTEAIEICPDTIST